MTLRVCLDCTTTYAVGVKTCPHCGSERGQEQGSDPHRGDNMPKITRYGGPSNAGVVNDAPAAAAPAPDKGGEQSSPGNSSETSSEKPQTSTETSSPAPRKRAPGTASRSKKGRTASSTARSTATDGPKTDADDN